MQSASKSESKTTPEFKPRITPAQVREKLAKDKANNHKQNFEADVLDKTKPSAEKTQNTEKPSATEKTLPAAEKGAKRKKESKSKSEKKAATTVHFPVTSRINAYGFIYTKAKWLTALGWQKGMTLKIERNSDGSITVRKV
jgi:hypothetical protein